MRYLSSVLAAMALAMAPASAHDGLTGEHHGAYFFDGTTAYLHEGINKDIVVLGVCTVYPPEPATCIELYTPNDAPSACKAVVAGEPLTVYNAMVDKLKAYGAGTPVQLDFVPCQRTENDGILTLYGKLCFTADKGPEFCSLAVHDTELP